LKNWYDYLGIDTSKYPKNKTLWLKQCKKLKINSLDKYKKYISKKDDMPKMPEELYNITNIINEFDNDTMLL